MTTFIALFKFSATYTKKRWQRNVKRVNLITTVVRNFPKSLTTPKNKLDILQDKKLAEFNKRIKYVTYV